ncbi:MULTISPECIES: zinc-binding alcohol dehydrogenase [unclassified Streptomyces]|uniref:zinc-dependent alcohol dehydrogenase n=1 Tax=unclassified Streptomyces TaxID=2593676 RepID=UPI00081DC065|nr:MULTISPECIES: zinc-binding alcohol dehydrogenase [unclassified Streptomyces]MYR25459.1 zinc-binding dehydrogenase [Streptomyces sp. SID4945]SCD50798.1 2-desacetyl-2-hydroxyethyl bacteriochlorophyllide A dehydrogenase [Streptomyces sp. TverLS-915]SCE81520.1 2-desacetyl-2-hydroxyethyl bacteriochlorophyllide A dehydrogenase [Streptomyces sp. LcepLS]
MESVVQFTGPRQVEVASHESAELPPGHLRVRTRYSGISAGTELTAYRGTNPYLTRTWDAEARLFRDGAAGIEYPVAGWGYSEVGEVTEVSPELVGRPGVPAPGDLVWGIWGHRSEGIVPVERMTGHTLPSGLEPLAGAFARVGAIAYNAVLAADIHVGEDVAVFGQGVIGLLTTRLAQLNGARVTAVDALDGRLATARSYGATHALNARTDAVAERIREATDGAGADVAIEISGAYPALHEALRSVTVGGRVVASGFYQGDGAGLRLGDEFHHNRVQLICSQIGGVPPQLAGRWTVERLQRTFLALVAEGRVDVSGLVSHVVPVAEAADAYVLLDEHPADALQVVLSF